MPDATSEPPADPIVARVCAEMQERSRVGLRKYCVGLDRTDLTPVQWLQHFREELMDGLNYATRLQEELERGAGKPAAEALEAAWHSGAEAAVERVEAEAQTAREIGALEHALVLGALARGMRTEMGLPPVAEMEREGG